MPLHQICAPLFDNPRMKRCFKHQRKSQSEMGKKLHSGKTCGYKERSRRRSVEKEPKNNNWIQSVRCISTRKQLLQFINLWSMLRNVSLNPLAKDEIRWKWMPNGEYTAASAYEIQFQGSHAPFEVGKLWKASVEPKVKVFEWMAMHQRILTADNQALRGLQHNPSCPLCNSNPEDARHLLINCTFAQEVHQLVWSWFHFQGTPTNYPMRADPARWLAASATRAKPAKAHLATRILLYSWWNVWKERNRHIFESTQRSEFQVACAVKEDAEMFLVVMREFRPP
jgi:hypothetical protein